MFELYRIFCVFNERIFLCLSYIVYSVSVSRPSVLWGDFNIDTTQNKYHDRNNKNSIPSNGFEITYNEILSNRK